MTKAPATTATIIATHKRLLAAGVTGTVIETATGPGGIACVLEVDWPYKRPNRRGPTIYQSFIVTDGLITYIEGHDGSYVPSSGLALGRGISTNLTPGRNRMPQRAWSDKRERQYEHIKDSVLDRGEGEDTAEEIAARTVNKERARSGEAKESSRTSTHDISSGRRGGLRSHSGPGGRTRDQLYNEAREKNIAGRSKMSKAELERAVGR